MSNRKDPLWQAEIEFLIELVEDNINEGDLENNQIIAKLKNMKNENISNLKKAVYVLLNDQYDVPDLDLRDSSNSYIDSIIGVLIEKNENICPYKNYGCIEGCNTKKSNCIAVLNADCNRELEDIWRDFITSEK